MKKLYLILLVVMVVSCRKEIKNPTSSGNLSELINEDELYFVKTQSKPKDGENTILGEKIINPNKISFIQNLTKQMGVNIPIERLTATHIYVKFLPQNTEDITKLVKRMDEDATFIVEQIPFHYKVEQYGKKFENPETQEGSLPPLYSTVKAGYNLPKVKYEVLDSMLLPNLRKEFTPQEELAVKMAELIGMAMNGEIELNENYLDKMIDSLEIDLDEVELNMDMDGIPSTLFLKKLVKVIKKAVAIVITVVKKGLHYIQKAIEIFFPNAKIRGYVEVENNNKIEPLNGMRVNVRRFFVYYDVYTNMSGYFETREECPKGLNYNVYLGNQDNLNNKIQSGRTEQFYHFSELLTYLMNTFTTVNEIGSIRSGNNGTDKNKILVKKDDGYFKCQLWNKALVCNAIKEYNMVARENGMVEYKNSKLWLGLSILPGGGMAGMFYTMGGRHISGFDNDFRNWLGIILFPLDAMYEFLPDILIKRRDNEGSLYKTVFHELSHYSHAMGHENKYNFWGKVAWGEIRNSLTRLDPYGNGETPKLDFEYSIPNAIGLAESWAYFMQEYIYYMYREKNNPNRYFHYIANGTIYNYSEQNIESFRSRKIPSKYSNSKKEEGSWFPIGLYHDMIDNSQDEIILMNDKHEAISITKDIVSGFKVKDMYIWMTHSYSVESFMEKAMQTMPWDGYHFDQKSFDKDLELYAEKFINGCENFKNYYGFKKRDGLYIYSNHGQNDNIDNNPNDEWGSGGIGSGGSNQDDYLTGEVISRIIKEIVYLVDGLILKPKDGLSDLVKIENMLGTLKYSTEGVRDLIREYIIYSNKYRELEMFYNKDENKIFRSPKTELESLFKVYRTRI